jgi:hypothetical protein
VQQLKPVSLRFESTDKDRMEFFSSIRQILGRACGLEGLLRKCLILEFIFFHEYLSHAFPTWTKDVEPVSEGFLFALEFDWFESAFTGLDLR